MCDDMVHCGLCGLPWFVWQIVIDVGDIPQCFISDVPGLEILHHFLHEGQ